jgi:hypothetical protein
MKLPPDLRSNRRHGSSVFEFVLVLPAAALVIVVMIGSAQTLLLRQYALVASRQAVFYQRVTGCIATSQLIGQDIPAGDSPWQLYQGGQGGSGNSLQVPGGSSIFSSVAGFIRGADGSIDVQARNTPRRGYISRSFQITDASAEYSLIGGYWTSNSCSVVLGALTSALGALGSWLHLPGTPSPGGGC